MPKKQRSQKQLDALARGRAKAAANRAAKQEEVSDQSTVVPVPPATPPAGPVLATPSNEAELIKIVEGLTQKVAELEANQALPKNPTEALDMIANLPKSGAVVTSAGVQGQIFKYPVDKSFYPDPTPRLYDDPELKRFAMRENYYFKWDVSGETYEKYNITYTEPRFWVELYRFMFDEDGVTPTGKMILVARQLQHEDELAARIGAQKLGLDITEMPFQELMDEMRYQRIRQWLLALFRKPNVEQHRRRAITQVIDGKVVEVYDTEQVIDGESGISKASTLQTQDGIGKVTVPQ